MPGFYPLGDLPLGEYQSGGFSDVKQAFVDFINSQRPLRVLIEITAVQRDNAYLDQPEFLPLGDLPLGDFPSVFLPNSPTKFLFGDGPWYGRPQDDLRPNQMAIPRISSAADISILLPQFPETARRGNITLGNYELINPDGGIDFLPATYSIGDQNIAAYVGPADGDFKDFHLVTQMNGDQFEGDFDTVRVLVSSTVTYLDVPLYIGFYTGAGGLQGDPALTGTVIPACFGDCFNVTPILIVNDFWLYQVHDGPIEAIDAVKERGVPFDNQGDFPDYDTLIAYVFADSGQYATCLALGIFRASFAGSPAGPITADVRGDKQPTGYSDLSGDIMLAMALHRAGLGTSYVDEPAFAQLPAGAVGYYTGQTALMVSDAFNAFCSGFNGWYGTTGNLLLSVGYIEPPLNKGAAHSLLDNSVLNIQQISQTSPPRYKQTVTYRRNWTPMADSDVSVILDSSTRGALIASNQTSTLSSQTVKARDRSAVIGSDIATLFRDKADADGTLNRVMSLYKESTRLLQVDMPRSGYLIKLQEYIKLTNSRFGFSAGRMFVVLGVKYSGSSDTVTLTIWG